MNQIAWSVLVLVMIVNFFFKKLNPDFWFSFLIIALISEILLKIEKHHIDEEN